METGKKWYESTSIWSSLVVMLSMVLGAFGGYAIDSGLQTEIVNLIMAFVGLIGAVVSIYGRVKATKQIK